MKGPAQDFRFHNIIVRTIMTAPILTIDRNTKMADIVSMMLKKNISSIPVVDKGKLVGIITRRSLCKINFSSFSLISFS